MPAANFEKGDSVVLRAHMYQKRKNFYFNSIGIVREIYYDGHVYTYDVYFKNMENGRLLVWYSIYEKDMIKIKKE